VTESSGKGVPVEPGRVRTAGWRWFAGWVAASLAAAAALTFLHIRSLDAGLQAQGQTLHRVVSQRADQHDALLTSLGAIVRVPGPLRSDLVGVLAESMQRFYPRVRAIEVVAIGDQPKLLFTTRETDASEPSAAAVATRLADEPPGRAVLLPGAAGTGLYHVLKRAGTEPVALVLTIDAERLAEADAELSKAELALRAPDGTVVLAAGAPQAAAGGPAATLAFDKVLGSQSQPLTLSLHRAVSLGDAIPFAVLLASAAGLGLLAFLGHLALSERRKAAIARQRARLSADEARLAQATRVNAMGELASGIAHELAQPIAAILSQSQAGARLARGEPFDRELVVAALEANARLARRAGAILDRLRDYVRPGTPERSVVSAEDLVGRVLALSRVDLTRRGITVSVDEGAGAAMVFVEPIAIEQALFNLIRNAAEAVEDMPPAHRHIRIAIHAAGEAVTIAVEDDGPGLSPELTARLFEPFRSTKANGMGLGLALSQRLVEANGGRISGEDRSEGGARFVIGLPRHHGEATHREAAE
jgi:two-component system, LuxR family, sensor kinase FixL